MRTDKLHTCRMKTTFRLRLLELVLLCVTDSRTTSFVLGVGFYFDFCGLQVNSSPLFSVTVYAAHSETVMKWSR